MSTAPVVPGASPRRIIRISPGFILGMISGESHYRTNLPPGTKAVGLHYSWKAGAILLVVEGPGILAAERGEPLIEDYGLPEFNVKLTILRPEPTPSAEPAKEGTGEPTA